MNLVIRVKEIKGHCPVYKVNDSFKLIEGYKLVSEEPLCMQSLAALLPHYNALTISSPGKWGLAGKKTCTKHMFSAWMHNLILTEVQPYLRSVERGYKTYLTCHYV